jgi:hypothetical protein
LNIPSIASNGAFTETNNCGSGLAASANCSINVTFSPSVVGSQSGAVTIVDNDATSPQAVRLSGTGK